MSSAFKAIANLALVAIVAGASYAYRDQIGQAAFLVKDRFFAPAPCSQPIEYSLGSFDPQFGLTKAQFLGDVASAAKIWDQAAGKELFRYDPVGDSKDGLSTGELKVNLIYDYRQRATAQLESLGLGIKDDLATYDAVKAKYAQLLVEYDQEKASVSSETSAYSVARDRYDSEVSYWNAHGGAPEPQYDQIKAERTSLDAEASQVNASVAELNQTVDSVNSAAAVLNHLAGTLNLSVQSYNAIGSSTGPEFDEGEYVEDSTGRHVDIYQFSTDGMLVRVLAHELGHSLGLQHVQDPHAIMYYLNQSTNETPTSADLAELDRVCGSSR